MNNPRTQPTGVTADKTNRILTIKWADGHESVYGYDGLRAVCPCVECKGGHANMGVPINPDIIKNTPETDLTLESLSAVGTYALQLNWGDGHTTGIFTWQYLRNGCPCSKCV